MAGRERRQNSALSLSASGPSDRPGRLAGVSYLARVRVVVFAVDSLVTREGVGVGHGIDVDLGLAHESAAKEAETDAMKRALMTFGNQFGLALYDKTQEGVEKNAPFEDPFAEIEAAMLTVVEGIESVVTLDKLVRPGAKFSGDLAALPDMRRERVEKAMRNRRVTLNNQPTTKAG